MFRKLTAVVLLTSGSVFYCQAQQQTTAADTSVFKVRSIHNPGTSPLYVLDGKIIDEQAAQAINPATIEKIDVLQNAAATERYGEMAKNGAVIITSKGQEKQGIKKSKQRG